jgi:hypothetical protein
VIECVYIAASARDARYTRICVASVRYFYPEIPIRLLAGGRLQRGLADELLHYWNVVTADLRLTGEYGWGFVKLEPLFGPHNEQFLVLDSDTVLTGPVLELWNKCSAPFLVDNEDQAEADVRRLYYDWEKLQMIEPNALPPRFVFNSGQWFGTAGVLTRNDFAPWVNWTMPRSLRHPTCFMPGEQGILNYVLNQKSARGGLLVERQQLMRWAGHSINDVSVEAVSQRNVAPRVVHWAGVKKARQQDMAGADLLGYFEQLYYERLLGGEARRVLAGYKDALSYLLHAAKVRAKLAFRKFTAS